MATSAMLNHSLKNHDRATMQIRFILIGSFALSLIKFRKDLNRTMFARDIDVHIALPDNSDDELVVGEIEKM